MEAALNFAGLLPWLIHVKEDEDLTLRAQSVYVSHALKGYPALLPMAMLIA